MTPEQQRIALAEACGWKCCCYVTEHKDGCIGENPRGFYTVLPDYLNDLNAMHEALQTLNEKQGKQLVRELYGILERSYEAFEYAAIEPVVTTWFLLLAASSQLAEAFLRTLNLWKETSDDNH